MGVYKSAAAQARVLAAEVYGAHEGSCKKEAGFRRVYKGRVYAQARVLAAEVYGAHEQGGEWDDEGEWHLVNDGDFDSSDDDGLGAGHLRCM